MKEYLNFNESQLDLRLAQLSPSFFFMLCVFFPDLFSLLLYTVKYLEGISCTSSITSYKIHVYVQENKILMKL